MSTVSAGAILRCSRLSEEWVFGETGGYFGGAAVMNAVTTVIELLESQGSIERAASAPTTRSSDRWEISLGCLTKSSTPIGRTSC